LAKHYTIMVISDRSARVKRWRFRKVTLYSLGGLLLFLFVAFVVGGIEYFRFTARMLENRVLRQQNIELRNSLLALNQKVEKGMAALARIERLETKLRMMAQINDPQRHLALGPFEVYPKNSGPEQVGVVDPLIRSMSENPTGALDYLNRLSEQMTTQAESTEGAMRQVDLRIAEVEGMMDYTPSIWPARGWITSTFGMRTDPFTGELAMHHGIDISNEPGIPVMATAKGVVVFTNSNGSSAYGKEVVIDHGFGKRTRYAHLNEVRVKVGDSIERRQVIGTLGNSGRSTGPHLHYEVEVNGVFSDPKNFILED
jgi:murein DD-endopeptidase MepM/ murein hydrolase activator NlpD